MTMPSRADVSTRLLKENATRHAALALVAISAMACSSSSSGNADSGAFGGGDSSTTQEASTTIPDAGPVVKKDSGTPKMPGDGGCGSNGGSGWCTANAPVVSTASYVMCDDFDYGTFNNDYSFFDKGVGTLTNAQYVSPYCAYHPTVTDAGLANYGGAFTAHNYEGFSDVTGGSIAFDLFVPSGSSCEGVDVAYFIVRTSDAPRDTVDAWLKISNITGSGAFATGYTVTLRTFVGIAPGTPDGGGTVPSTPATIDVSPRAADNGWARISLDVKSFTIAASPMPSSVSATVSWSYIGGKTPEATSPSTSSTGTVAGTGATTIAADLGVFPDLVTPTTILGCEPYIDDYVSNLTTSSP